MSKNNKTLKYLKDNYNHIDLEKDDEFLDLSIFDQDIEDKKIFLTGENHGVKSNEKLRMKYLKYFKWKTDFKYYLCELPYSLSYFLNIYLETGNIHTLKEVYRVLEGTDAWNENDFNHWIKLYEFNKELAEDKKIKIIGIDIEHQTKNALEYMNHVLPKKSIPIEIEKTIKYLVKIKDHMGKVLSIAYVYHNCKYLYPTVRKDYVSSINTLDLKTKEFKKLSNSSCTVFKLNGKNSPFNKELIWPISHKMPQGGVTTDYFQYLIVIKDSDSAEPLVDREGLF